MCERWYKTPQIPAWQVTSLKKKKNPVIPGLDVAPNRKHHVDFPRGSREPNPPPSPRVETVDCGDEAASWLSDFLGQPCRLIRQNPNFSRDMKKRLTGGTYISISPPLDMLYMSKARAHFLIMLQYTVVVVAMTLNSLLLLS